MNYLTWANSKETNVRKAHISQANSINIVESVFLYFKQFIMEQSKPL